MNDLTDLDWSKGSKAQNTAAPSYTYNASAFAALKPTPPTSGRATPLNPASSQPSSKPTTPANDSFSNLVSFSSSNSNTNLSLQEQQKRIAELKLRQQKTQSTAPQNQFAGGDDEFWNNFGSGRSTPAPEKQKNGASSTQVPNSTEEDDIFAAFNKPAVAKTNKTAAPAAEPDDDDDPFGLSQIKAKKANQYESSANGFDDDDVLGLLGQPASNRPKSQPRDEPAPTVTNPAHPQDRAVAELVDMGFPVEKAREALEQTDSGTDVQAAVGWLLNQAHQESHDRSRTRREGQNGHATTGSRRRGDGRTVIEDRGRDIPEEYPSQQRGSRLPVEKDPTQIAAEIGNNFLRTAGSLWKQGSKRFQQAVQELNSDSDSGQPNQPKWMKEPPNEMRSKPRPEEQSDRESVERRRRRSSGITPQSSATNEAMMLEAERPTPPPRPQGRSRADPRLDSSADNSRDHSPVVPSRLREAHPPQPVFLRQQQQPPPPRSQPAVPTSRTTLNRQANEEQAAQAYVSSARRRKPQPPPVTASEPDLLEDSAKQMPPTRPSSSKPTVAPQKPSPITSRPPPPVRNVPPISDIKLRAAHTEREKGNALFKRGDFAAAHLAYTSSISHIPPSHPLIIVLLTNRALTALKVGEPKTAINDSDNAVKVIGPSKGESETIDFSNGEIPKPMREYYGKALMRKAEALEQMEKWSEAALVWREAVEGGHGGATSMQGRLRAEKAANPQAEKPKSKPQAKGPPASRRPPAVTPQTSDAAVRKLRAANAAADKVDDEKFALSDTVDARLKAWKDGKQDNLRALLGSLDTVLWPEAGWKKISMADLVLPAKVKIQYMKGIAKVHPDKIPTTATTEQRMIAGAVFSTLNEAWDKFKTDNGL